VSLTYDCRDDEQRAQGLGMAAAAIGRGELVVLPTDTVYGLAADAFDPGAVAALLAAKGRGRQAPPPVLVASADVLTALCTDVGAEVMALTEAFWPGGLTLICWAQPSLSWDLGDTGGTVAVRVPAHPVAASLLQATGPLAVSSANVSGQPPGATAAGAQDQLGADVAVYLEDGEVVGATASTMVDATGSTLVMVRAGAVGLEELREVVPDLVDGTAGPGTAPADAEDRPEVTEIPGPER